MKKILILLSVIFLSQCHSYKSRIMKREFNFYTQYNQFYLEDKENKMEINQSDFWSEVAFNSKLATAIGIIGIGTHSYGNIKGELIVLEKPYSDIDYSKYDHIVEAGIVLESGVLQIVDCPNSSIELEIKVKPGNYKVRVYGSNFDSVLETDLANDTDNDYYKIEIWPSNNLERKVLKQYGNGKGTD